MIRDEKKLFQTNKLSYNLVMLFVILNTAHAIFTLQNMTVNYMLGIFIMITIFISMISFLTAVKLQTYSMTWSYIAIGIGILQGLKYVFRPEEIVGTMETALTILVILSMVFIFIGAIISINRTKRRQAYIDEHGCEDAVGH